MTNSSPDHNISASKTIGLVHTLVRKTFPTPAIHTITSITKTKWKSGFMTKKDVKPPTMACTAQASLAVLCRCLMIGPTTGRLAWSLDSRSLLRTVWLEIRTFARPRVLRAVSSAVIIRFRRWIRRKCLSWSCDVTCGWRYGVCHSSYLFVEDESLASKWLF